MINKALFGSALMILSNTVFAVPVDLSTWLQNGGGSWTLAADNNSVTQEINTPSPAVFFNDTNSQGLALSGQIQVITNIDDDFIGFVLGYDNGDDTNAAADYLLIDWKQADQGSGKAGLAISRVTGQFNFNSFWAHTGVVNELQRATNLGSTGWNDFQVYDFDLIFNPTNVQVKVDGVKELDINGNFSNGSFGFYNLSQEQVLYAGIEEDTAPPVSPVPAPGVLLLLMTGFGAMKYSHFRNKRT